MSEQVSETALVMLKELPAWVEVHLTARFALWYPLPLQIQIYQFALAQHFFFFLSCLCIIRPYLSVYACMCCVVPGSDVPALQTVARLPPWVVQSLRGARDLPEPLRSAVVPHSLRLAVPPWLCVPHLWYIFRIMAPCVCPHTNAYQHNAIPNRERH